MQNVKTANSTIRLNKQGQPIAAIKQSRSPGQRAADRITRMVGSWWFLGIQSVLLLLWIYVNIIAWVNHWDPYPFILLNLMLSFQAAYTAPVILMSQNREAEKDRHRMEYDYLVNRKAEREIQDLRREVSALRSDIKKFIAVFGEHAKKAEGKPAMRE